MMAENWLNIIGWLLSVVTRIGNTFVVFLNVVLKNIRTKINLYHSMYMYAQAMCSVNIILTTSVL